ncbi:MAG: LptF/LptG family permease, partial [Cyclobacteriaceae bacterium]|nr:LptF/LptG family permease [Cyclobacteriaceae bacterium]
PGLKEPGNQDTIRKLEAKNRIKRKLDTGTEENVTQARPANKVPVGNSSIIPKVPVMDSLDKKKMKEIIANSGLSKSGIELDSLKKKGRKIPTRINTDSTRLKVLSKVDLGGKDSSSFKENINIAVLIDSILEDRESDDRSLNMAVNNARQAKTRLESMSGTVDVQDFEKRIFQIQWHKIIANAIACFTMFLIGAPLGAIIKKGGLGIPVLLSILFFIIFYVLTMMGEKWAKQGLLDPWVGIWMANFILLPIGMFFMKQARKDARLFDSDFYNVIYQKIKKWYSLKKNSKIKTN